MSTVFANSIISSFKRRFHQFGGLRLVYAYARLGILWKVVSITAKGIVTRDNPGVIYSRIIRLVAPSIKEKYSPLVKEIVSKYDECPVLGEKLSIVWFCWLQGIDTAPEVVKKCFSNLKKYLVDRDVRFVDSTNICQYISLPDVIRNRWEKRQIPSALYSDMVRLELLIKYGGTWIDSTVLCSGSDYPREYLDSNLFFFRYARPGSADLGGISNWFISSCRNHPMLLMLRDLLSHYWEEFDCTLLFPIFHLFFSMIAKERPDFVESMPYGNSRDCLVLEHRLGEPFNRDEYERILSKSSFHKLTYRLSPDIMKNKGNYYDKVIRES